MRTKTDEYIRARYKATYHFMVSEVLDDLELYFKGTDTGFHSGFHCVILDLKDLPSHLF